MSDIRNHSALNEVLEILGAKIQEPAVHYGAYYDHDRDSNHGARTFFEGERDETADS